MPTLLAKDADDCGGVLDFAIDTLARNGAGQFVPISRRNCLVDGHNHFGLFHWIGAFGRLRPQKLI